MQKNKSFAIITDFGFDYSVASMKAIILQDFPDATIIDIDHSIEKFSVLSGAFVINSVYRYFPEGTIFICVIDPGVGSSRDIILVKTDKHYFVGPNNGIFHYIIKHNAECLEIKKIKDSAFSGHSNTFHGRDIITPAAIEMAKGNLSILDNTEAITPVGIEALDMGEKIIIYTDNFGNVKTNIEAVDGDYELSARVVVKIGNRKFQAKFLNTFSDAEPGELICYRGSNQTLELALNLGSAKEYLSCNIGDKIEISNNNLGAGAL